MSRLCAVSQQSALLPAQIYEQGCGCGQTPLRLLLQPADLQQPLCYCEWCTYCANKVLQCCHTPANEERRKPNCCHMLLPTHSSGF